MQIPASPARFRSCRNLLFLVLVVAAHALPAQSIQVRAGMSYGGPVPRYSDPDSSSGSVAAVPAAAVMYRQDLRPRLYVQAGLQYYSSPVTYSQIYRQDTSVVIELLPGMRDTLPTYYYAFVNGRMHPRYVQVPVELGWRVLPSHHLTLGLSLGYRWGGQDTGTVRVQIGNGGFFGDEYQAYDNAAVMRRLDYGVQAGYTFEYKGFSLGLRAYRYFRSLYDPAFFAARRLPENPMFQTGVRAELGYTFPLRRERTEASRECPCLDRSGLAGLP